MTEPARSLTQTVQASAIAWMAAMGSFWPWAFGAAVLGAGTAMVYPTLLATIYAVAAITAISGAVVIARMYETHPPSERERNDVNSR